jgi:hypothetical protein
VTVPSGERTRTGCSVQVGQSSVFCGRERWDNAGFSEALTGCRVEVPKSDLALECGVYHSEGPGARGSVVGCPDTGRMPVDGAACLHAVVESDRGPVRIVICSVAGREVDCWDYSAPGDPDYCLLYLGPEFYCYVFLADPAGSLADCIGARRLRGQQPPIATGATSPGSSRRYAVRRGGAAATS